MNLNTFAKIGRAEFAKWLQGEMDEREVSQADLARQSGLATATVSLIMTGERGIGPDACRQIAHALNLPEELVFQKAGFLTETQEYDDDVMEMAHLFSQLPENDRQELIQIARMKLGQAEDYRTWKERFDAIPPKNRAELIAFVDQYLSEHGWRRVK